MGAPPHTTNHIAFFRPISANLTMVQPLKNLRGTHMAPNPSSRTGERRITGHRHRFHKVLDIMENGVRQKKTTRVSALFSSLHRDDAGQASRSGHILDISRPLTISLLAPIRIPAARIFGHRARQQTHIKDTVKAPFFPVCKDWWGR